VVTAPGLVAAGFTPSEVTARTLNIDIADPLGRGPFCRLDVTTSAPEGPGVYAWAVGDRVMYVGKAKALIHIVRGQAMDRPYNSYTYIPPSKVQQLHSPRVGINGRLNAAISAGQTVTWWWRATTTETDALDLEARLIRQWVPPWNRARPTR
jgi:hypothetical protein